MTKIVEYQCNLCRLKKPVDQVNGIYWISESCVEVRLPQGCENHICQSCMEAVHKAMSQHKPAKGETYSSICNLDR